MKKIAKKQKDRMSKAAENYEEMKKVLAPFLPPHKIINLNTQGQWQKTSTDEVFYTQIDQKKT